MRKSTDYRTLMFVAWLALLAALLTGCQPTQHLSDRVAYGDWSRGTLVGRAAINEEAPLAVDPSDGSLWVAWVTQRSAGETGQAIQLARLDPSGRPLVSTPLALEAHRPSQLRLEADPSGTLDLFWLEETAGKGLLWHAVLSAEGQVHSAAALTPATVSVGAYATTRDPAGGVDVVWAADEASGRSLNYLHVGSPEEVASPSIPLGVEGLALALERDAEGTLHIAWAHEPDYGRREVRCGTLDPATGDLSEVAVLATLPVPMGQVLRGPALGLAGDGVYVFWALERRGGGLAPPSAESRYVFLPGGRIAEATAPRDVIIPAEREPAVASAASAYRVSRLAPASPTGGTASFIYYASAAASQGNELAVAFSVQLAGRTQAIQQIVLTLWAGGEMRGYQVAAETPSSSIRPSLVAVGQNDLAVSWIDTAGFGSFEVFVAGTADTMRAYLDRWRLRDVAEALLDALWGLAQAAGFLPMTVAWFVPPLVLLTIYAVINPEGDLARRAPRIMLVAACLLYEVFKFMFRPSWLMEFPVPAGLDPALADRIVLLAPVGIAVLAALLTMLWARRKDYPSLFPAFLIFAGCDALLTLLVYVPSVLSE
jgi:hypothetical protein